MAINFEVLKAELDADPLGRGYAGMTDQQAADSLNSIDRTRDKTSMTGDEIFQATDQTELAALDDGSGNTSDLQHRWVTFTRSQDINPFASANIQFVIGLFSAASQTVSNLQALRVENISRAVEIGVNAPDAGIVLADHVNTARSLP